MTIQVGSSCHFCKPCRALNSKAWWLLCQPSPKASSATHLQHDAVSGRYKLSAWARQSCMATTHGAAWH